jgi:hypothetical protein
MHAGSYTVPYKVQLSYWLHNTSAGLHEESEACEPGGFSIYVAYGILSLRYLVTRGMSIFGMQEIHMAVLGMRCYGEARR